jgi:hypothetical protein
MVQGDTIIGEVCHISAASPNGPRYDPQQSPAERHGFDNLILLCANHHLVIDDDPEAYTVERLRKMKANHESTATTLGAAEIDHGTNLLIDQSVHAINQSGGITAHTVNQTFHLPPAPDRIGERKATLTRARELHQDQVEKIKARLTPIKALPGGMLVIHLVPFGAIDGQPSAAFDKISRHADSFLPIGANFPRDSRITFDGLFTGSNADGLTKPQRAYVHVFQTGTVQAVVSSLARGGDHDFLVLPQLQAMIIKYTRDYAQSLRDCGIDPPFVVFVSLVDVYGMRLTRDFIDRAIPEDLASGPLNQNHFQFVETVFEAIPSDYQECAKLVRATLNHMSTAAELRSTPYFDAAGNYTLPL